MLTSENVTKLDIRTHVKKDGSAWNDWYVGITSDPDKALFENHKVNKESSGWIYRLTNSPTIAKRIRKYFLAVGLDGGIGDVDNRARVVYAYKKTASTKP